MDLRYSAPKSGRPLIVCDFVPEISERVRCYLMRRMIDPSRFAEDMAGNAISAKQIEQKTDAEAVEEWEDEGSASSHSGGSVIVSDLSLVTENEIKGEAKCT